MRAEPSNGQFRLLSAMGASALSIWQLRASQSQLQALLPAASQLAPNVPQVISLRDDQGRIFDQAVTWLRTASGECELHLHGGHGPAMALRQRFKALGWSEQPAHENGFLNARGQLNAYWHCLPDELRRKLLASPSSSPVEGVQPVAKAAWPAVLEQPPRIVLAGPPNSGKSTIFNAWLQSHRVTVSPHPGTTRDAVEAPILLPSAHGTWQATLVDTAGIWSSAEELDQRAINEAKAQLGSCWKVIWIFDPTDVSAAWPQLQHLVAADDLVVCHKHDLLLQAKPPLELLRWNPLMASAEKDGPACTQMLEAALVSMLGPIPAVICG
jgi:small GTP-binding protein